MAGQTYSGPASPGSRRPPHGLTWLCLAWLALGSSAGALAQSDWPQTPYSSDVSLLERTPTVPFGLPALWRTSEQWLDNRWTRATSTYSKNSDLVGVRDGDGIRVLSAATGTAVHSVWTDPRKDVYSFAISSRGEIALGRAGWLDVHKTPEVRRATKFACADACGPVLAMSFSPDGSMLAYQSTRSRHDRRRGLGFAVVLDTRTGELIARLEASASRAFVEFSSDGQRLLAASVTPIDDSELFGIRAWDTADWSITHNVSGSARRWRALGERPDDHFVAAYERDGMLEVRELANEALLWSVPLIPASLDATPGEEAQATKLELVEFAPRGEFVVSYESPRGSAANRPTLGTVVIRRGSDGAVEAMYDVADVTDLTIAPDGRTFAYSTGGGQSYTVVARVPL